MAVPYTFGTATAAIPLSNLDGNFATTITLGNTAIQLGNTVTTLNNMTLANATISSGNVTLTNVTVTTANVTTGNITTVAVGSGGIKSAGNVVVGTTTDFTSTTVPGAVEVAGYGIYPYVSTGTTNTTIFSGIQWFTPTAFAGNNGASAQTLYASNIILNVKNDGSGGTNQTGGFGLNIISNIESTGVNARVRAQGIDGRANRYSATDLSTRTDNTVIGVQGSANHITTAPGTIFSGNLKGGAFTAANNSGTATQQTGVEVVFNVGNGSGAPTTTSTQAYAFHSSGYSLGQATGNAATITTGASFFAAGPNIGATGTMTTFYGLFLGGASISGTLTNNWGVYSADTAAKSYFGGTVGVGTTSPDASAILDAQSTTKGVRMPNMTTTQKNAISSPAAGLMVFDTTLSKLCVYSGAAWQTITSV